MNPSNLPPGVTDYDIEEAAGAFGDDTCHRCGGTGDDPEHEGPCGECAAFSDDPRCDCVHPKSEHNPATGQCLSVNPVFGLCPCKSNTMSNEIKSEEVTIKLTEWPESRTVARRDYIAAKAKQLREFGYSDLTEAHVMKDEVVR